MKRLFSIFLLMIMLLAAMQPTLVFHYCGKSLRSVGLEQTQTNHCCSGSCCSDYKVTIATDDFQTARQESVDFRPLTCSPVLVVLSDFVWQWREIFTPLISPFVFPPGGFARCGVNWLTFICIFRI